MRTTLSGTFQRRRPRGWSYYVSCIFFVYGIVQLIRLLGTLVGYSRKARLEKIDDGVLLREEVSLLGARITQTDHHIPSGSILTYSIGQEHEPGLLIFGASLLFYLSLFGVYKAIIGLMIHEPGLVLWGLFAVIIGLVIDTVIFAIHWYLASKWSSSLSLTLVSGERLVISGNTQSTCKDAAKTLAL